MNLEIFDNPIIKPLAIFGLTGNFWSISYWTVIHTWVGMLILFALALVGRFFIKREGSLVGATFEYLVGMLVDLCKESFKPFNFYYFAFVASIFLFTLFSCLVGLIPFLDEATKDLNTTLALGSISFFYVQWQKICVHGFFGYCKEFAEPFALLAPINIIGELAKIASMSFRLFGNILGGGVIYLILLEFIGSVKAYFLVYTIFVLMLMLVFWIFGLYKKDVPHFKKILNFLIFCLFLMAWVHMFFGVFEGLIQSFVITMLTITYLSMGTQVEEGHAPQEHHEEIKEPA